MKVSLYPAAVFTGGDDNEARLLVVDGQLAAVLVRLEESDHGLLRGAWYLEAGFGPCAVMDGVYFASLDEASEWVRARVDAWRAKNEPPARAAGGC